MSDSMTRFIKGASESISVVTIALIIGLAVLALGLSASCIASPARLKASTVNSSARPGNSMYHQ